MRSHCYASNVRLVDVDSERVLLAIQYNCEPENLHICDQLTDAVALQISGSPVRHRITAQPLPAAPAAHMAYLKGRYLWNKRTEKDLYRSIEEFQQALAIDPGFALAHTGLADSYVLLGIWGFEPSHSAFGMARRAAERAIELDDGLAEAHTCLGEVLKDYDWDWPAAEYFRRAIAINSNYSTAHHFYAQLLVSLRRFTEAAEQLNSRLADPLSPQSMLTFHTFISQRAIMGGRRRKDSALWSWSHTRPLHTGNLGVHACFLTM
jgi:tetratricopeptide (TPR) repeat protein